jgi:hypothetical protein
MKGNQYNTSLQPQWLTFAVAAVSQPLETVLDVWPRSPASIFFVLRRHRRATAGETWPTGVRPSCFGRQP